MKKLLGESALITYFMYQNNDFSVLNFSTFIDSVTRQSMGQQAVALAKSVQYNSAGSC